MDVQSYQQKAQACIDACELFFELGRGEFKTSCSEDETITVEKTDDAIRACSAFLEALAHMKMHEAFAPSAETIEELQSLVSSTRDALREVVQECTVSRKFCDVVVRRAVQCADATVAAIRDFIDSVLQAPGK